ncbi:hypothetical protein [Thiohalocapsa marina]|uniref:hypothetical protein n=1 Tax=Thiohalocapsa marina TaxID=424902 RepID=UPI0036D9FF04
MLGAELAAMTWMVVVLGPLMPSVARRTSVPSQPQTPRVAFAGEHLDLELGHARTPCRDDAHILRVTTFLPLPGGGCSGWLRYFK